MFLVKLWKYHTPSSRITIVGFKDVGIRLLGCSPFEIHLWVLNITIGYGESYK